MKSRATLFLSGVSHEFASFCDAVENEVEMKGCFAENQPGFPPDYRTVEEMLRRKLNDSDAIVGCTNISARPRRTSLTRRSKTSNRSTRPSPTAATRVCTKTLSTKRFFCENPSKHGMLRLSKTRGNRVRPQCSCLLLRPSLGPAVQSLARKTNKFRPGGSRV